MAENNGGAAGAAGSAEGGVRTFTQEEVNAMIGKRVNEVTSKYADYEALKEKADKYDQAQEANKTELQKATERADQLQKQVDAFNRSKQIAEARAKVAKEKSLPVELLTGDDEESCRKQADAILNFAKPQSYPGTRTNAGSQSHGSSSENSDAMREFARNIFRK